MRALFLSLLSIPAMAHAGIITFDDDFVVNKTLVGSSYSDVTFGNAKFIAASKPGVSGAFAIFSANGGTNYSAEDAIYATFTGTVDFASIVAIDAGGAGITMEAYDADNNLIGSETHYGITAKGRNEFCTLSVTGAGIKTLKFYQPDYDNADGLFLDDLKYNVESNVEAVPEPASMAVLGLGVVAFLRRRRAR